MGYRVSWIACQCESPDQLLNKANFEIAPQQDVEDFLDLGYYLLSKQIEGQPWHILIADGTDYNTSLDETMAREFSATFSTVIYFWCNDTVMATEIMEFRNQKETWSVRDSDDDKIVITGKPPKIVNRIPSDSIDYDTPAVVGKSLMGFRHDQEITSSEGSLIRLKKLD